MIEVVKLPNRHPVDEMQDLKEQIERLESRRQELRQWLIYHPEDRVGSEWRAVIVRQSKRTRYDLKAIVAYFGKQQLMQFRIPNPITIINVYRKKL